MYRYVAFVRNVRRTRAETVARSLLDRLRHIYPGWSSLDWGKGVSILHSPPAGRAARALELSGDHGAILGTLFPVDLATLPCDGRPIIDEGVAEEIARTRGRHLMRNFWGGYVTFLNNREGAEHYILRDCSGKIPCYTIACGDVTIVTSNIEDLAGLSLPPFSVNARYLAGFISSAELAQRECALNEVTELLAGECLELTETGAKQFSMWDPRIICREQAIEGFDEACSQVREVTQICVDLWASKYDRIVHLLSGGLDSSVILGCLKRSPHCPLVTCLHIDSDGAGEQELAFAQLAAKAAGTELIVQPGYSRDAKYDERIFRLPRTPKPSVSALGIAVESGLRNLIPSRYGAEAIWDGQGGDHLFFEPRSALGAVDYAFRHGISGDFSQHVRDAIRRSRLSYWGVIGTSLRLGLFGGTWQPEDEYDRVTAFVNPDIVPTNLADYIWQPWLADATDLPPGKRWQICLLGCLIHRHRPIPELQYATEHHPLFSQPLFELCLRIPIYTLLRGGLNRALERAAFRDRVPEQIIRRENKGSVAATLMSKIRECLPFLRELVLDGVLVQQRIIEREALEPFLAGNRPVNPRLLWPFLSCIAAEVWARKWESAGWRL